MSPGQAYVDDSRVVQTWKFTSILSTAVTMSAAVGHAMELPAKMKYEPSLYVRLQRTLYPMFGRTAGYAEVLAVLSTGTLAWWTHQKRQPGSELTIVAAACLAAAHGVFWGLVAPANKTMANWSLQAIPEHWQKWRDQWEYSHAVRALLVTGGLAALVAAVMKRPENGVS